MAEPLMSMEIKTEGKLFGKAALGIWEKDIIKAIEIAITIIKTGVQERSPARTGTFRNSIVAEQRAVGIDRYGVVGTPSKYALPLEKGRKPGSFPNYKAIRIWTKRKFGLSGSELDRAAYLIARSIYQKGTKAIKMFERTMDAERVRVLRILDAAVGKTAKTLGT